NRFPGGYARNRGCRCLLPTRSPASFLRKIEQPSHATRHPGGVKVIMTRTPLRISIGGGGTDLPSYYRENGGGFVISAAITKYVYITVNRSFFPGYFLKYSETEHANTCH